MRKNYMVYNKAALFTSRYWAERNMEAKGYTNDEFTVIEVAKGIYAAAIIGFIPDRRFIESMGGLSPVGVNIEPEGKISGTQKN